MKLTRICLCVAEMTKKYSNLPEAYIKRSMEQIYYKTPRKVMYRQAAVRRKKFYFSVHRPWTQEFYALNQPGTVPPKVYLEPIQEWMWFKGDRVEILVGKDAGKQGIINYIVQERNWVLVEGLNCKYINVGKKKDFPGMLVLQEQPLLVTSEIALLDPSDSKPTEVEWRYMEEGEKVRVSKRTERIIPIPRLAEETYDYKTKSTYKESDKDTKEKEVTNATYEPSLCTFEMDIMKKMGIKEDRVPKKTYWYFVHP